MDLGLQDKIALVAGGSRGCGFGIAAELANEGAAVALSGRQPETVESAVRKIRAKGGRAAGIVGDMTTREGVIVIVEATRQAFGDPDILIVNPPGIVPLPENNFTGRGFENSPDESFQWAMDLWMMTLVWLVRQTLPAMKARKWGRIVSIASECVKAPHLDDPMILANTRVVCPAIIKTLAHEYGQHNITCNTIATGPFMSELTQSYMSGDGAWSAEEMLSDGAMKRWGQPEEMGAVVAFLCSTRASYLTGETIRVDGNFSPSLF